MLEYHLRVFDHFIFFLNLTSAFGPLNILELTQFVLSVLLYPLYLHLSLHRWPIKVSILKNESIWVHNFVCFKHLVGILEVKKPSVKELLVILRNLVLTKPILNEPKVLLFSQEPFKIQSQHLMRFHDLSLLLTRLPEQLVFDDGRWVIWPQIGAPTSTLIGSTHFKKRPIIKNLGLRRRLGRRDLMHKVKV